MNSFFSSKAALKSTFTSSPPLSLSPPRPSQPRFPSPPASFFEKKRSKALERFLLTTNQPNLYEVMGLLPSASAVEIKKAFKKMSLKHHPDKSSCSHEAFLDLCLAHQILSDPDLRRVYDEQGLEEAQTVLKISQNGNYQPENF